MKTNYWDSNHPLRVQERKFIEGATLDPDEILRIPVTDYREKRLQGILRGLLIGDMSVTEDPQARALLRRRNEARWNELLKNAIEPLPPEHGIIDGPFSMPIDEPSGLRPRERERSDIRR
jgi:hypothetical protein